MSVLCVDKQTTIVMSRSIYIASRALQSTPVGVECTFDISLLIMSS